MFFCMVSMSDSLLIFHDWIINIRMKMKEVFLKSYIWPDDDISSCLWN